MVFIGLKTFPTDYPKNIPDSYIVAVGGGGYSNVGPAGPGGLPTATGPIKDGLKTATADLDL